MTAVGFSPMLTPVDDELVSRDLVNRLISNTNWCASNLSFGLAPFRIQVRFVDIPEATSGDNLYIRHRGNNLAWRINIVSWATGPATVTVFAWDDSESAQEIHSYTAADGTGAKLDSATLSNMTEGNFYRLAVTVIHGVATTGTTSIAVEQLHETGNPAGDTWQGVPTVTDGGVSAPADWAKYRDNLNYFEGILRGGRTGTHGSLRSGPSEITWVDNNEHTFWDGYVWHTSDNFEYAFAPTTNWLGGTTTIRLHYNMTGIATATSGTENIEKFVEGTADLSGLGLSGETWYYVHATYQFVNGIQVSDAMDAKLWYAHEVDGDPPGSYTPPSLFRYCADVLGSAAGGSADLTELNAAQTDLNNRIAGYPNMAARQTAEPVYFRRRRDYLHYADTSILGYGGVGSSAGEVALATAGGTRPVLPEVILPSVGVYDLSDIGISELYVVSTDETIEGGPATFVWEDDLN